MKKITRRRAAALGLALILLLGLAACGKDGKQGGEDQLLSSMVYVPQFLEMNLEGLDDIAGGCVGGDWVYLIANKGEETTETDAVTGETYPSYVYKTYLYRLPLAGGEAEKLENYQMTALPEGTEGGVYIEKVTAGEDNTLWVTEVINAYTFDLPEDFDENTDDRWSYEVDQNTVLRRQLDAAGNEITRTELDASALNEKLEAEYTSGMNYDREGNIYVTSEKTLFVLDQDQNLLFSLDGEQLYGELILLGDGTMALLHNYYDEEKEISRNIMKTIDLAGKAWGPEYVMPVNAYSAFTGGGDYLFYYQNNDSIYGCKAGSQDGEKLFSWIDSDINRNDVSFFDFTPDGRVVVVTREWVRPENGPYSLKIELAVMTATDRASLPEKTTLTYATMYLGYDTRQSVIDFNKKSGTHRIVVQDYSEFNTEDDTSAGLSKLNTEIVAGKVPDLLDTTSLPLAQYGAKGVLEDLWPFIENDPDLGREAVMERVLQANEMDGKLYEIFNSFYITTVAGSSRIVGDSMSWTLADLQEALTRMPEGCTIFGQADTKSEMLRTIMSVNADAFVDWDKGECRFDSDSFKSLLAFCNSFPAEFNWNEMNEEEWEYEESRIMNGKQMLVQTSVSSLDWSLPRLKAMFQGDVTFVGYPTEDGSVGSCFASGSRGIAMSTACKDKDGAWSFMRQCLLPVDEDEFYSQFYVNKADFEKAIEKSMEPNYEYDENGEIATDENGQPRVYKDTLWISPGQEIEMDKPTQADYDQFMELYNAIDRMYRYDENVYNIVNEQCGAYFSGDKSLEETASQIQSRVKLYVNENK